MLEHTTLLAPLSQALTHRLYLEHYEKPHRFGIHWLGHCLGMQSLFHPIGIAVFKPFRSRVVAGIVWFYSLIAGRLADPLFKLATLALFWAFFHDVAAGHFFVLLAVCAWCQTLALGHCRRVERGDTDVHFCCQCGVFAPARIHHPLCAHRHGGGELGHCLHRPAVATTRCHQWHRCDGDYGRLGHFGFVVCVRAQIFGTAAHQAFGFVDLPNGLCLGQPQSDNAFTKLGRSVSSPQRQRGLNLGLRRDGHGCGLFGVLLLD